MADTEPPREWHVILNADGDYMCKYEFGDGATTIHCGDVVISVPEARECGVNVVSCEVQELKVGQEPGVYQVVLFDQRSGIRIHLEDFIEQKQAAGMASQLNDWLSKVNEARRARFYDRYEIVDANEKRLLLKQGGVDAVFVLESEIFSTECPFVRARAGGVWYLPKHAACDRPAS